MMRQNVRLAARVALLGLEAYYARSIPAKPTLPSCRDCLRDIYMAINCVYAEHRDYPMQPESQEFLQALHEAFYSDDINHQQALEAALVHLGTRLITTEPGVAVALAQARVALLGEVRR
jgi:hypothetical protein